LNCACECEDEGELSAAELVVDEEDEGQEGAPGEQHFPVDVLHQNTTITIIKQRVPQTHPIISPYHKLLLYLLQADFRIKKCF